jgi:hypothetical protein
MSLIDFDDAQQDEVLIAANDQASNERSRGTDAGRRQNEIATPLAPQPLPLDAARANGESLT